ncbi:MAG: hypothetical protein IPH31_02325 [Lewinellaceae bacterium]|nr:hypothetical protein [Lewinellaceae bacterium]
MNKTYLLVLGLFFFYQNVGAQVDTVPPALVCKNILPVDLSDHCYGYLKVQALVDTVYDDSQYYELTYRKECTGEGFPSTDSLQFLAGDGTANVELWARDSTGNISSCKITLFFLDQGFCHTGSALFFTTAEGDGIDSVSTHVYGTNCLLDSMDYHVPTSVLGWGYGWMSWTPGYWSTWRNIMPAAGYSYDVVPSRNNDP